jgi:Regulator of chromosome condensation (RCC1) repeat
MGLPHSMSSRRELHAITRALAVWVVLFLAGGSFGPTVLASTVVAWGETSRPSGSPPSMTTNVPAGLVDAIAVAGGPDVGYAIRSNGTVVTWGNPLTPSLSAVPPGLSGVIAIAAGAQHTLALRANGKVIGWGDDQYGKTDAPALLDRVMALGVGNNYSAGLRRNGAVLAWGNYNFGQALSVPVGLNDAVAIASAANYGLALRRNGTVVAWGGIFNQTNVSGTVIVPAGLSNVVAIAASFSAGFALRDDGTVFQWGSGIAAGPIPGFTQICAISVSVSSGVLALREDGTLVKTQPLLSPIPVGISNVVALGGAGTPSVVLIRNSNEPFITQHPQSQSVAVGAPATFHVGAAAGQSLTCQWQFNGINLRGATQDTLQIKAAWPAQVGHYRVLVSAAGLTITSRAALLRIIP